MAHAMLSRPLNPLGTVLAEYDDLAMAAARRYGKRSQAVGYVLYEELIFLRQELSRDPGAIVLRARAAEVRSVLHEYYRLGADERDQYASRRHGSDPVVVEFDRDLYVRLGYAAVADRVAAETVTLDHSDAARFPWSRGALYLFVIDDQLRVRVWRRPFRYPDLVFGAARARIDGVPVAHPMLVPDRLRAVAAGEVVFVGTPESGVAAVVANTRSGHFRPPPTCEAVVRRRFAAVCQISERDVDVIVVS